MSDLEKLRSDLDLNVRHTNIVLDGIEKLHAHTQELNEINKLLLETLKICEASLSDLLSRVEKLEGIKTDFSKGGEN